MKYKTQGSYYRQEEGYVRTVRRGGRLFFGRSCDRHLGSVRESVFEVYLPLGVGQDNQ